MNRDIEGYLQINISYITENISYMFYSFVWFVLYHILFHANFVQSSFSVCEQPIWSVEKTRGAEREREEKKKKKKKKKTL